MSDLGKIRSLIEESVSQKLAENFERLRAEIVEQVVHQVEPLLATATAKPSDQPTGETLSAAIAAIQGSNVQADILKALLEGTSKFSARAALFVVRGSTLAGWQARGFVDDNVRGLSLDGAKGLASRTIHDRTRVSASASEFDSAFIAQQGSPSDGNATLFPLVVKDKVAALLYCDAGREAGHHNDYSAVEVLTRYTCLWLEHAASKKHSGEGVEAASTPAPITATPSPVASNAEVISEPSLDNVPADEQEVHKKAKRFAKLLVDEIKLYNQSKVAEGKQNRDLYKLLREDIEKSRATYDKRYGSTPAGPAKYFDSEVVRILADNDRSLLGSDFPG